MATKPKTSPNEVLKEVPLSKIKPNDMNPRFIRDHKFEKLVTSLKEFPEMLKVRRVVLNKDNIILGGNMRIKALKEAGVKTVPVTVVDWPEEKQKEFIIKDNINFGEWDWDLIANDWDTVALTDYGLDVWQNQDDLIFHGFNETADGKAVHESADVNDLLPHPNRYRNHPEDQIEHLVKSIEQNGIYQNIVLANDNTILDGHGLVEAAKKVGINQVPVVHLPIDSTSEKAIKILATNNEVSKLTETDDRKLTEILRDIKNDEGLEGTGFDDMKLASLVMVTRSAKEISGIDEAKEWIGMPEFQAEEVPRKIVINFRSEEDRKAFGEKAKLSFVKMESRTWTTWWPDKERDDLTSLKFE